MKSSQEKCRPPVKSKMYKDQDFIQGCQSFETRYKKTARKSGKAKLKNYNTNFSKQIVIYINIMFTLFKLNF